MSWTKNLCLFLGLVAIGAGCLALFFHKTILGEILQEAGEESLVSIVAVIGLNLLASFCLSAQKKRFFHGITALLLGAFLYQCVRILPYRLQQSEPETTALSLPIRIGSFNVLLSTTPRPASLEWLKTLDLAVLLEFNHEWDRATQNFYGIRRASQMYYGVSILSKTPCLEHEEDGIEVNSPLDNNRATWQRCLLNLRGMQFNVYAVHPTAPVHSENIAARRRYMQSLSQRIDRDPLPKLVIGDFNSAPWSSNMQDFAAQLHLQSAYRFFKALSTYPVESYPPFIFGLPIDHILYSKGFKIMSMQRMPDFGSDHYPIQAILATDPEAVLAPR